MTGFLLAIVAWGLALLILYTIRRAQRRERDAASMRADPPAAPRVASAPSPPATRVQAPPRPTSPSPIDLSLTEAPTPDARPWQASEYGFAVREALQGAERSLREMKSRRELLLALSRPGLDARQLTNHVIVDPALSAQILRTVNSPFYALSQPMASVFRAVLYLGHIEVRNIVWRTSLARSMGLVPADLEPVLQGLWRHAFSTSRIAYGIAKSVGLSSPDGIATAALLHDVGKLIALTATSEDGRRIPVTSAFSRFEDLRAEADAWGVCHTLVGAELGRLWGLPDVVVDAIERHHLPSYLPPSEVPGDARALLAVHLADVLAHARERDPGGPGPYRPCEAWREVFGVSRWEEILTEPVQRALRHSGPDTVAAMDATDADAA